MLAEERKAKIVNYINEKNAVSAAELMQEFNASEATIRRDLTELNQKGLISKVHGGAVSAPSQILTDNKVSEREEQNPDKKQKIAKYAASLIKENDYVFLDAGTTTGHIIDYITEKNITIVTNAILHAHRLSSLGFQVYLTGGRLKSSTEALVGPSCFDMIEKFNFTIGFFGANGVSHKNGVTTPDIEEAKIKEHALSHTRNPYVLCDPSKFHVSAPVRFALFSDVTFLTTEGLPENYRKDSNVFVIE